MVRFSNAYPQGGEANDREPGAEHLTEAVRNRDEFLREHPELRKFQDEIDRRMELAGPCENRIAVLGFMLEAKLHELLEHLSTLRDLLTGAGGDASHGELDCGPARAAFRGIAPSRRLAV